MSAPALTNCFDPDRTRVDDGAPPTLRDGGKLGRGAIIGGKYRLELLLGEGGMASVWSAYNLELELPVAIKLLRAGDKTEKLAERLRLEARAAARLVHPSIVRVFDVAVAESGDPFIVMELLTGESLGELLARGRLNALRAVQILLPIAEALALAHAKGIVHRDLKPDNVFLSTEGEQLQPKLLDFGIAKLEFASAQAGKLTDKGMAIGSPSYMSPEQVRGEDVDYRTDIWSFCILLYKAVTGAVPFSGPDKRAVLDAILSNEPRPITLGAGVDKQLARLICWGLAKDPLQRPSTIRELARQLAQWLLMHGVSDDACGTPLAARWLAHVAEPSMRRPPPLAPLLESESEAPDQPQTEPSVEPELESTLAPEPSLDASSTLPPNGAELTWQAVVRPARSVAREQRHWLIAAAAVIGMCSGAVAWKSYSRTPPVPARAVPMLAVTAPHEPAPESPAPESMTQEPAAAGAQVAAPVVLAASTGAAAPTQRRAVRSKSASSKNRPPPASQLPF